MYAKKWLGQRGVKGDMEDCFIFDSWFSSNNLAESSMDVGAEIIGMVKTNPKLFFKDTIEDLTNYWPGDSCLVLRSDPMVPRIRSLITAS